MVSFLKSTVLKKETGSHSLGKSFMKADPHLCLSWLCSYLRLFPGRLFGRGISIFNDPTEEITLCDMGSVVSVRDCRACTLAVTVEVLVYIKRAAWGISCLAGFCASSDEIFLVFLVQGLAYGISGWRTCTLTTRSRRFEGTEGIDWSGGH